MPPNPRIGTSPQRHRTTPISSTRPYDYHQLLPPVPRVWGALLLPNEFFSNRKASYYESGTYVRRPAYLSVLMSLFNHFFLCRHPPRHHLSTVVAQHPIKSPPPSTIPGPLPRYLRNSSTFGSLESDVQDDSKTSCLAQIRHAVATLWT